MLENNTKQKMETWAKTNKLLFNEEFKALALSLIVLHKRNTCTFTEIFEGSGLKRMGASTSTVSRALKSLEKAGVIVKEKAPFPFKTRYRLVKREAAFDKFNELMDLTLDKLSLSNMEPISVFPEIANVTLLLAAKCMREGKYTQCAFLGFMLLDYMFHVALNIPLNIETQLEHRLSEMAKEKKLLEKVLQIKAEL